MLRDYLRSFWRGVLHNKVATLINVGGLALGLTVFFALSFYVYREFSWDAHWEDADRIFVASGSVESAAGNVQAMNQGPYVLGDSLQARHPGTFENYVRVYQTASNAVVDANEFPFTYRYHAERGLLDLLQFETIEGSLQEVFADPRAVAISRQTAERIFGDASPLGRTVTFKAPPQGFGIQESPRDFVIKAVFSLPQPTTFNLQVLATLETTALPLPQMRLDLWQMPPQPPAQPNQPPVTPEQPFTVAHYFKLREGVDVKALEAELRAFMDANRHMDSGISKTRFVFRNIQDLHLSPSPFDTGDNMQRLWVYAAIGVLVLLISGCNFVMLATLRIVDRMRDVGIRKSVGAGTAQLLWQYLLDAFLHTLLAALLAVAFLALAFPRFSVMLELPLQLDLLTPRNLGLCFLMTVLFTLVSSLYPAWMTAQGRPGPLLRNGSGAVVGSGIALRKLLVGIQFAIVVVLLLATVVVRQQIDYTRSRDPGYSLENVVQLRISTPEVFPRIPALLAEFRNVPGVDSAAVGGVGPGAIAIRPPTLVKTTAADGRVREAGLDQTSASADYFRTMSIPVLAGTEFSAELDAPPSAPAGGAGAVTGAAASAALPERKVILNAAAARLLGFDDPAMAIEQLLESETTTPDRHIRKQVMRVVGVVADTQLASVMLPPPPQFYNYTQTSNFLGVKFQPGTDAAALTAELRAAWDRVVPGSEFNAQDNGAANAFILFREQFEARIITGSTVLAIIIALLGLYGLVAATMLKRVKEIGVRKVMGAERKSIVGLFLLQFSKPIVVANVIAWPFGFWAVKQWLTRFPYQLDTTLIVLSGMLASLVALAIAWLTVGVMAARAASVKPVAALRYE